LAVFRLEERLVTSSPLTSLPKRMMDVCMIAPLSSKRFWMILDYLQFVSAFFFATRGFSSVATGEKSDDLMAQINIQSWLLFSHFATEVQIAQCNSAVGELM